MDRWLRRATPIVLLVLAGLAWFERWLPGHEAWAERFGDDGALRFVVGLLCIYLVMLVAERERMERTFVDVLKAFRDFRSQSPGESGPDPATAQREAVELLVAALDSDDPAIRDNASRHLQRLTGQDLGPDPAAWRAWLRRQADGGKAP